MAFFELTNTSEIGESWFAPTATGDVMAMVYRDGPTSPWKATIRVRLRKDDLTLDSTDEKRGMTTTAGTADADKARLIRGLEVVVRKLARAPVYHGGGGASSEWTARWARQPWVVAQVAVEGPTRPQ